MSISLIRRRDIIRNVPSRWGKTYDRYVGLLRSGLDPKEIQKKLDALDVATCTPDDIKAIIGNDSWTINECDMCKRDRDTVVGFSEGYSSLSVCKSCLKRAAEMIGEE